MEFDTVTPDVSDQETGDVNALTRRALLTAGVVTGAAGMLGLAACSTDSPKSLGASAGSSTLNAPGSADGVGSPTTTAATGASVATSPPSPTRTTSATSSSSATVTPTPTPTPTPTQKPTTTATPTPAGKVLAKVSDVPVGNALSATLNGKPILISQPAAGTIVTFSAICTHMGCTVAPAGKEFHCPCHGSVYNSATGAVIQGPAPAPLKKIATHVADGDVIAGP